MAVHASDYRNLVLCGHGSCGKTTLADRMLFETGAVSAEPSVDRETSVCDFDPEEKAHHHSVEATLVRFPFEGKSFQVLDAPGRVDFVGQLIESLYAVENAVIVIDAHAGVEVNTRRAQQHAERLGLSRFIVIDKIDRTDIDVEGLLDQVRGLWGKRCVVVNVPDALGDRCSCTIDLIDDEGATSQVADVEALRAQLVENLVERDEELLEKYFDGEIPSKENLRRLLHDAVHSGDVVPVAFACGKTGCGVKSFLKLVADHGRSPEDFPLKATRGEETVELHPEPAGEIVARVFKTRIDPYLGKLSFVRLYSGTLKKDDNVHASGVRKNVRVHAMYDIQGEHATPLESAGPGAMIAIAKLDDLHTGTVLGELELEPMVFPTPMVGLAVAPKSRGDEAKLSVALHKILEEDPTFRLDRDPQTKELVMNGMSERHLTLIQERLHRRDKLDVETHAPKIPYRETIQSDGEGSYRHRKQTGGRGQFGEVHIRMYPFPTGQTSEEFLQENHLPQMKSWKYDEANHFLFVDSIVGGSIPHNFMPAIEKGFHERLETGVIAGCRVQDLCVEVFYGKHHPVDSSEQAFKTAARMAFKQVFEQCSPTLLEPIVKLEVTVPEANVGDIYGDISARGGRVLGSDSLGGGFQVVNCEAPLRELSGYARTLTGMTAGQGSFSMEFCRYEAMPHNVRHELVGTALVTADEEA